MKLEVQVGNEFDVASVSFPDGKSGKIDATVMEEARNRTYVSIIVLVITCLFLVGAGILGIFKDDFGRLQSVYNAVSIPASLIIGYYFGNDRSG